MSLLNEGNSSSNSGEGNTQGAGSGAGANSQNTGSTGGTQQQSQGGGEGKSWLDTLPAEYKENASIKGFKAPEELAKGYINLLGKMGADKVVIPGKHATQEDWDGFFSKLGRPESPDKYEMEVSAGGEEIAKSFKEAAHKAGLLPSQVKAISDWNKEIETKLGEAHDSKIKKFIDDGKAKLKEEWTDARFDKEVGIALQATKEFFGKEYFEWAEKCGVANDPMFIKMMNKVGHSMSEDKLKGDSGVSFNDGADVLQKKINDIVNNSASPYWDRNHAGHQAAVAEVSAMYEQMQKLKNSFAKK